MGAVYRARRILLGDEVAIKVILADMEGPASARALRPREPRLRAAASPQHRLDLRLQRRRSAAAVPGDGAAQRAEPERGTGAARAACRSPDLQRIVPTICSALALAHSRGIIHRDLKPANIVAHDFVPGDRVYKIVDFGVANVRQVNDETRLTGSQQFIGTVAYAPPEQLTGGVIDARSDVYSLGVVLFELVDRPAAVRRGGSDGGGVGASVQAGAVHQHRAPGSARLARRGGGTRTRQESRGPLARHGVVRPGDVRARCDPGVGRRAHRRRRTAGHL